jgi:hypothetical protein
MSLDNVAEFCNIFHRGNPAGFYYWYENHVGAGKVAHRVSQIAGANKHNLVFFLFLGVVFHSIFPCEVILGEGACSEV